MSNHVSISVVLPVYNEEDHVQETIKDADDFLKKQGSLDAYEIIAVNDGSTDQTGSVLEELKGQFECLKVVSHATNFGYGKALVSGVNEARFPWVLMMDADGQFKISALSDMLIYIPDYDIVTGYRYKRTDPFHRIFIGRAYTFLACVLFGLKIKDVNCGFKLFRKDILDFDGIIGHAGAFYAGVYVKAKARGCKIKEVPVEHFPRVGGKQTGVSVKVVFAAILDLFRLCFSQGRKSKVSLE